MTSDKIIDFFISMTGGFLILFSFLIFLNPQKINRKANFFFGLFFLGLTSHFVPEILVLNKISYNNFTIEFIFIFFQLFITFFFYYGVKHLTNPIFLLNKEIKFIIGFIVLSIVSLVFTYISIYNKESEGKINTFFEIFYTVNIITYCYLSLKNVKKHQFEVVKYNSNIEKTDLKWVEIICYMLFLVLILHSLKTIFLHIDNKFNLSLYLIPFYLVGILFIAYHIIKQKDIYTTKEATTYNLEETNKTVVKREIIEQDRLPEFKNLITKLFESEKPYLDSELNLIKTAEILQLTTHQVSFILNEGFKENFSQFVNRYRIEEAKKLIANPKMNHLSLLGIGYEVGFNSKTVFNTTFKKSTGKTPSEYKKLQISDI